MNGQINHLCRIRRIVVRVQVDRAEKKKRVVKSDKERKLLPEAAGDGQSCSAGEHQIFWFLLVGIVSITIGLSLHDKRLVKIAS